MSGSADEVSAAAGRRLATVGRLAGAIAHDFNNQLTAILGYAGLLLDELAPDDPRRADIEEIQRSGERAARLTRQLLAFRRNADAPAQLLAWPALLEELGPLLTAAAGPHVSLDVGTGASPVCEVTLQKSDASHVAFAIALLAREAMPAGGRCRLEARESGRDVVLSATLEPGAAGGTAPLPSWALADLSHLAEASGGKLTSTGDWPAAVRFDVRYPAAKAAVVVPDVEAAVPPGAGVLVVEHDRPLRLVIRRMLERDELTVVDAASSDAALGALAAQPSGIDVLVTDVVMPGASGVQLARTIVAEHPGIVVLFISGYVDLATLDLGSFTTPVGFLAKPFTRAQLVKAIGDLLAERQRRATG